MTHWLLVQGHKVRSGDDLYVGLFLNCYLFMTNTPEKKLDFMIYSRISGRERKVGVLLESTHLMVQKELRWYWLHAIYSATALNCSLVSSHSVIFIFTLV